MLAGTGYADSTDADRFIRQGAVHYRNGSFEQAAAAWSSALGILSMDESPGKYMNISMRLADAYQDLGYHERALSVLQKALPAAEKNTERAENALFFSAIGDLSLSLGNIRTAAKYAEKSIEEGRQSNDPDTLARVLNNVGVVLAGDENYEGALGAFAECLALIDEKKVAPELKPGVLMNISRAAFYSGRFEDMADAMDYALGEIDALPESYEKASDLISMSLFLLDIRNGTEKDAIMEKTAFDSLREARRIGEKLKNDRLVSYAIGYTGRIYEDRKRFDEAEALTTKALFHARQGDFPEIAYLWKWQLGRLFKAQGKKEDALRAYEEAVATLNPVRGTLLTGYRGSTDVFNQSIKPVYLGLADLLLKKADDTGDEKKRRENLIRARDIMELLKTAELQDFFHDECVTAAKQKTAGVDKVDPKAAVVYPIPLDDRLAILLTLPDGILQISVPVDSEKLRKTVQRFRHMLQDRTTNRFLNDAKQLYDWLIRPMEPHLSVRKIETLVFAPDGALRLIPFSTLHDGNRFLVEKYAIATIPAFTLTQPKPIETERTEILIGGLSDGVQGFNPLPGVVAELADIRKIMEGKTLLRNREYSMGNLREKFESNDYNIIHLATHGVFGGTPDASFLLTYEEKMTMDMLEQWIGIQRFRENQVELLTLSACQTALGNERAAMGLAGVAVKAGVRSAIATLWYVDDESTSLAVREFYRQLKTPGIHKAKALQNAQKTLINQPRYWHPLYWAPFLLIGNWL